LQNSLLIITNIFMRITLANKKVLAQGSRTIDNGVSRDLGLAVVTFSLLQNTINHDLLKMLPHLRS
jgi:hypothetical protein